MMRKVDAASALTRAKDFLLTEPKRAETDGTQPKRGYSFLFFFVR